MTYLIRTKNFSYLYVYKNTKSGFRESKILTINNSAAKIIEQYERKKENSFIKDIKKRGFDLEKIKIVGDYTSIPHIHIQVEITDGCNLSCSYCYRSAISQNQKFKNISYHKLKRFLINMRNKGLLEIGITGGEPTIHPKFKEIMRFCLKNFEMTELITNGTNSKKILDLLKSLKDEEKKKLNLSVSFHSWYSQLDNLKNNSHYLNKFIEAITKIHPIRTILTDFNYSSKKAKEAEKLLKKMGIKYVDFSFVSPIGKAKNSTNEKEYLKRYPEDNSKRNPDLNQMNCSMILRHTLISPEGNLRPCALFPLNVNIGKMNKKFIEKKYNFLNEIPAPSKEICKDCSYLQYCKGCIYKGFFNSNKNCTYKQKLKKYKDLLLS